MVYIIFIFFFIYFVFVFLLWVGWNKAIVPKTVTSAPQHLISVIIALRNEAGTIPALIQDLKLQTYKNIEIIFVDDHSTDNTKEVVERCVSGLPNFQLITHSRAGKKSALTEGINKAKGSIIVTTDADCRFHTEWLQQINSSFDDDKVKLVFGAVRILALSDLFSKIQSIEFASVIGTGVAAHAMGYPLYCNGANLAYRKTVFFEVGGYDGNFHIPSGDDEYLMRKIKSVYPKGIVFINTIQSVVTTSPLETLTSFVYQRMRWASKWKGSSFVSRITAFSVFLFHCFFLGCLLWWVLGNYPPILPVLMVVKVFMEFVFIFSVCSFLQVKWQMFAFLILQFSYSLYVVCIGMMSRFFSYHWKGRTIPTA